MPIRKTDGQDKRGQIDVLNFWATWYGPCNVERPILVAVNQPYSSADVVFTGALADDRQSRGKMPATAFIDRKEECVARILVQMPR